MDFVPKVKPQVVVSSTDVDKVVDLHHRVGPHRQDRRREDLERCRSTSVTRVRTGEKGDDAL